MTRRWITLIVLLATVVFLSGCSGQKDETPAVPGGGAFNNNDARAKTAEAAPGPGSDVPRPGGGGGKMKGN